MMNKDFVRGVAVGLGGTLAGVLIMQYSGMQQFSRQANIFSDQKYMNKMAYIKELVDYNYLFDVDEDSLAQGMYAGYVDGLNDPYSYYFTTEEYAEETTYNEGSYVGIGITLIANDDGGCLIQDVYDGYPGDLAGLEPGDLIVGVNGEDMIDADSSEIASKVKGSENDKVVLTIYKENASEPMDVEVTLAQVEMPIVSYEMLEDQIGYIAIEQFAGVTPEQFRKGMEDLRSQGMERLVVDLRNNPGGMLDSILGVMEQILPEGLIVYMEDVHGQRDEYFCKGETPLDIPLAVLINGNSASASEIFAGAVKDYGIGTLVGTTTYGKGVVQALHELDDGSAVKLTIAKYYTPKGNDIHQIGVEPDVEVKVDEALLNRTDVTKEEDNQLQEAIRILKEK